MLIRERSFIGIVFRVIVEKHSNQKVKVVALAVISILIRSTFARLLLLATGAVMLKIRQPIDVSESHKAIPMRVIRSHNKRSYAVQVTLERKGFIDIFDRIKYIQTLIQTEIFHTTI